MVQGGPRALVGLALAGGIVSAALPAQGLEIFGVRLWGREDEAAIEVIDPLPYTVEVTVAGDDEDLAGELREASGLWRGRDEPASGLAGLLATARGDYRRLLGALYNRGYYGPEISIALAGREAAEVTLGAELAGPVPVAVTVEPGPRFRFAVAEIVNAPPWPEEEDAVTGPASVDFAVGEPARAVAITAASSLAIERWRELSYAKAEEAEREIIADHAANALEATLVLAPGRPAVYGPVSVSGTRRVDPAFVEYMTDLEEGEPFDPDDLERAQARLGRLGIFSVIRIEEGEVIGPDGALPMLIQVEDRPPRTIGAGASLSTIDGLGLEAFWVHRNLFGRAEQLRFDATIAGIGGENFPDDLTYELGTTFTRPGVIDPDTNLVVSLAGRREDLETYRETAVSARLGLTRAFGSELTGDVFLDVTRSRVEDPLGTRDFLTVGPELRVEWDRRDDAVNPTEGFMLLGEIHPFYEAEFGNAAIRGAVEGRAYRGFGLEDRFVLAGRARVGSYVGPPTEESPPGQLFFAGGGGSIRGYEFRSIGVRSFEVDGERVVTGGRSLVETSAELRARFGENFGGVAFLDAGRVGPESDFTGDAEWRLGAGLGVRYFTGFGPLRVDVATPIDRRSEDSAVAVYIGIGQAF